MTLRRTNYMGSALLAATTLVVAACGGGSGMSPPAANTAPVISGLADRSVDQDTALGPIDFGISDRESAAAALTLAATVDGDVFPADGVVLGGSGVTRTLTLTPLESATGAGNVTVTLTDPQGLTASRTFRVAVNARGASIREWALTTLAKSETDEATLMNGYTFAQDADDPAIFEPYVGEE
jgi:Big-like domain-containing protein